MATDADAGHMQLLAGMGQCHRTGLPYTRPHCTSSGDLLMAGLTGYKNIRDGLFAQLVQAEKNVKDDAQEAMLEAAIAGEEMVKHIINTTESSLSPGKDNRNWTFHMNQAVDSEVKRNGNTITGRIGWLKDQEFYFLIQEYGADMPDGRHVTPMNALIAGQVEMLKTLTRWGFKTL